MSKPPVPVNQVRPGALITPRFLLTRERIANWRFGVACDDVGDGLHEGTSQLEVIEVGPVSHSASRWLKVSVVGTTPPVILKLTAEEYANNFLAV